MPASGAPEVPLDVVGQGLERRDVQDPDGRPAAPGRRRAGVVVASRSRHQRNAARVLPLPVGAWMSVWWPAAIATQPSAWACVGPSNVASNQARTGALNSANGSATAVGTGGGAVAGAVLATGSRV